MIESVLKVISGIVGIRNSSNVIIDPSTAQNQATEITALQAIQANTASALNDTTITGTITALNGVVTVASQGAYTIGISVTGTFVASYLAEGQNVDGTWTLLPMFVTQTGVVPYPMTNALNGVTQAIVIAGSYQNVRIRAYAYTSGTISVALDASIAQQAVFSSQLGNWSVTSTPVDGGKTSYSASVTGLVVVATTPTDVFTISNASATKIIRLTRIGISGSQTTAGQRDVLLVKRSTLNTAGTSTAAVAVPHDSTNAAAIATVAAYTANPTVGTLVGAIRSARLLFATATGDSDNYSWEFGTRPSQAPVLRQNQAISLNMNSVAAAGTTMDINIEWTEE